MNADAKEVRPDTAPQPDRTFNSEGLWEPGQKLKFGGLLNAEPLERVQRADRSILMKVLEATDPSNDEGANLPFPPTMHPFYRMGLIWNTAFHDFWFREIIIGVQQW